MPHLELTPLECKLLWLMCDTSEGDRDLLPASLREAERSLFEKAYRAYRDMPPQEAA